MIEPRVVVSALLERENNGVKQVFVQTRAKRNSPSYLDMLEIPAGGVESYENVYEAIKREVLEETNLRVIKIIDSDSSIILQNRVGDTSMSFKPYVCQQVLSTNSGLPWYGFVFRCEVDGDIEMNLEEAKDGRWMSIEELKAFIENMPEKVFSLQYAVLAKYCSEF